MINEIHVRRDALGTARLATRDDLPGAGQASFAVEHFALTANNVTYAAHGVDMRYWDFYPAPEGWGIVPVWGFARVVASRVEGLTEGDRFYGYWPMASGAVLTPSKVTTRGFRDVADQRGALAGIYNSYTRVTPDMGDEAGYALFRPLYITAFLIDAMLAGDGTATLILSSASSKTALGLAQAARARPNGPRVIGLTSARNRAFTEATGNYDVVATYDEIGLLAIDGPATFVDFSGDMAVFGAVHTRVGAALTASWIVGDTHWDSAEATGNLPGPRPQVFFAPTVLEARFKEWGPAGFEQRLSASWTRFVASTAPWLRVVEGHGGEAAIAAFKRLVAGDVDPAEGLILSI